MHFYESTLIDTKQGIQCKVYANSHPEGFIIVKPKYIPADLISFKNLKKRFIFEKSMFRFNLFNSKEVVKENLDILEKELPQFFYRCPKHKNWFLVVPKEEVMRYHDPKKGLQQLMDVPYENLDDYLKATRDFIRLILKSGISMDDIGISHSTLLGNYTPGISDIDVIIFGKENGWRVINYLERAQHPKLRWKTKEDWAKYYRDRIVSKQFTEEEYVFNMVRKKDDGFFEDNVFSVFVAEKENETWYDWDAQHEPIAAVKMEATVTDDYNSHVRPGYYGISDSRIIWGYENVPVKRIVTWSRPFVLQARKGEHVEAVGLLEKVKSGQEEFFQLVIGYFDAYATERGEQEYLKTKVKENALP